MAAVKKASKKVYFSGQLDLDLSTKLGIISACTGRSKQELVIEGVKLLVAKNARYLPKVKKAR